MRAHTSYPFIVSTKVTDRGISQFRNWISLNSTWLSPEWLLQSIGNCRSELSRSLNRSIRAGSCVRATSLELLAVVTKANNSPEMNSSQKKQDFPKENDKHNLSVALHVWHENTLALSFSRRFYPKAPFHKTITRHVQISSINLK